jgi:hypothetical protein
LRFFVGFFAAIWKAVYHTAFGPVKCHGFGMAGAWGTSRKRERCGSNTGGRRRHGKGLIFSGQTATLDEAKTAIEERWDKWPAWADLSEAGGANVSEFRG